MKWPDRKDAKNAIPGSSARDIHVAGRFALRSMSPTFCFFEPSLLLVFRRFAHHLLMRNVLQNLLKAAQTFVDRHQLHQR